MGELLIRTTLEKIRKILERHKVQSWPDFLAEREHQLLTAYSSGQTWAMREALKELDMLYGGMGSFNDLVINREAGDDIAIKDAPGVNKELNELRSQLYQMIQEEKTRLG